SVMTGCEFGVIDVSTIGTPVYKAGGDCNGQIGNSSTCNTPNFVHVIVSGNYAYTASSGNANNCSNNPGQNGTGTTSSTGCEMMIWDITTPTSPVYVGGADSSGATGTSGGNGAISSGFNNIAISGSLAYISKATSNVECASASKEGCELQVWDISNPTAPTYTNGVDGQARLNTGANAGTAYNWVALKGNYLFVAKQNSGTTCAGNNGSFVGCELQDYSASGGAFKVQNSNSATVISVDTTATNNLLTNGDFEANGVTGWSAKGSSTLFQGSQAWQGYNSLGTLTTTAANDGVKYNYTFNASTQYTLSFYARSDTSITDINIGRQDDGSTDTDCLTAQTFNTNWARFSCTFTTGSTITSSNIYIKKTGATAETFFIDGAQLEFGSNVTGFDPGGSIQLAGTITSPTLFQNGVNSTSAFQVQDNSGTNYIALDTV